MSPHKHSELETQLQTLLCDHFQTPLFASLTHLDEVVTTDFYPEEQTQLHQYQNLKRRQEWAQGRFSIKQAMKKAGWENYNTHLIQFPHPSISLSHSQDHGLCVVANDKSGVKGLGVDIEFRLPELKTQKFFLSPNEQQILQDLSFSQISEELQKKLLQQIWSLKESQFKADYLDQKSNLKKYELGKDTYKSLLQNRESTEIFIKWDDSILLTTSLLQKTVTFAITIKR